MTIFALEQAVSNGCQPCITEVESALVEVAALRADLDRAIVNFGDAAATVCDMRAQLAKTERELIATASERDGLRASRIAYANEFPLNADGEPDVGNIHANIRSMKAQLAEAQHELFAKEAERAAIDAAKEQT